jgi:hypothetical protein
VKDHETEHANYHYGRLNCTVQQIHRGKSSTGSKFSAIPHAVAQLVEARRSRVRFPMVSLEVFTQTCLPFAPSFVIISKFKGTNRGKSVVRETQKFSTGILV